MHSWSLWGSELAPSQNLGLLEISLEDSVFLELCMDFGSGRPKRGQPGLATLLLLLLSGVELAKLFLGKSKSAIFWGVLWCLCRELRAEMEGASAFLGLGVLGLLLLLWTCCLKLSFHWWGPGLWPWGAGGGVLDLLVSNRRYVNTPLYELLFCCCKKRPQSRQRTEQRVYESLWFQRVRVRNGRTQACSRGWKLRAPMVNCKYKKRENGLDTAWVFKLKAFLQWNSSSNTATLLKPCKQCHQLEIEYLMSETSADISFELPLLLYSQESTWVPVPHFSLSEVGTWSPCGFSCVGQSREPQPNVAGHFLSSHWRGLGPITSDCRVLTLELQWWSQGIGPRDAHSRWASTGRHPSSLPSLALPERLGVSLAFLDVAWFVITALCVLQIPF